MSAAAKRSRGSVVADDGDRGTRETSATSGAVEMPVGADGGVGDADMPEPIVQQRKRKQKNKDGTARVNGLLHCMHES
jgi:hypothetical protein